MLPYLGWTPPKINGERRGNKGTSCHLKGECSLQRAVILRVNAAIVSVNAVIVTVTATPPYEGALCHIEDESHQEYG